MFPTISGWLAGTLLLLAAQLCLRAADGRVRFVPNGTNTHLQVQVQGGDQIEWRFQASEDLVIWTNVAPWGSVFSGNSNLEAAPVNGTPGPEHRFIRAVQSEGLFDPYLLRTIHLTFEATNWATQLSNGRTRGTNVPTVFRLENGVTVTNAGARYKGNTSFNLGGNKKSINLEIDHSDPDARAMGYRTINLNNAAGDETIMREPMYFNVMREYAPSPHGAMAKVYINGAYWGVYSMVDQLNKDLLDEWFPSNDGDRWRAPNIAGGVGGGGGGGFDSATSAFSFLGTNISSYRRNYELKSDESTNAWERLLHAITVLNRTPTNELRDAVEEVFAVDRWLWFLAVENVFVDDDSYWNKGADYAFYYEPESGRIHPVEHDGNEAFVTAGAANSRLSPLQGATGSNRPLLSKLLSFPELRQRYLAHMRTVLAERFNPAYLTPMIGQFHQLSVRDIMADPKKNFTMTGYSNELRALRTYITNRYNYLTNHAELRQLPPRIVAVHGPEPEPLPADVPVVTAQVEPGGTNGINSVWLYWRDKPYGRFSSVQMLDDGAHQDGGANDGLFGAAPTNFPAGNKIHYYIEARADNTNQTAAFAPARAEQVTYSFRVGLSVAADSPVVINELMADNERTLADPQGEFDDWIELWNLTDQAVDLTGLYLTDESLNPRKWPFPQGTTIPAGGYLLIWADENGTDTPGFHASFKLDKAGEQVLLIDTDANLNAVLDAVTFEAQRANRSYGRTPSNPDQFDEMQPTPGQVNTGSP